MPRSVADMAPGGALRDSYIVTERCVGSGVFGEVHLGRHSQSGEIHALKIMRPRNFHDEKLQWSREASALRKCGHPNVLKLLEAYTHGDNSECLVLALEVCDMDLRRFLQGRGGQVADTLAQHLFRGMLLGAEHIHTLKLVHRDIKPENVMLKMSDLGKIIVKVGDLGSSRPVKLVRLPLDCKRSSNVGETMTPFMVTPWYRAPEVWFGSEAYDCRVDLWSLGCILGEFLAGRPLFPGRNKQQSLAMLLAVLRGRPEE